MLKKSFALIMSLMMLLSIVVIPQGAVVSAKTAATGPDNVIKAAINFTNGEEGVTKAVRTALYSINFAWAPARLGLTGIEFSNGGATVTGNVPIRAADWSLTYDYLLEDEVVGLGGMYTAQSIDWKAATNSGADLTAGVGAWQSAQISLASLLATSLWSKPLYGVAFEVNTTAAVDTTKTYNVYYKNLKIVNAAGDTIYTLFDNSVTTQELNPQKWDVQSNASMALSVVTDPLYVEPKPNEKLCIKADVKFTNGEAGVAKSAKIFLFGSALQNAPESLGYKNLSYTYGGGTVKTGNAPVRGVDWKLRYEYLLEDDVVGLGGMATATLENWKPGNNIGADLTEGLGEWHTTQIELGDAAGTWEEGLHVAFAVSTTDAVDVNKTYTAYYRNIQVVDGSGATVYNLFDDTVSDWEIKQTSNWDSYVNVAYSIGLSVVNDPTVHSAPKNTNAIRAAINFTDGTEGTVKTATTALYSLNLKWAPGRLGLNNIPYWNGGKGTGSMPIASANWKFQYDYMLVDDVAGLGGVRVGNGITWKSVGNWGSDLSDGAGTWQSAEFNFAGYDSGPQWTKPAEAVALVVKTTEAVDTNKTYYVYYRNLRIVDEYGDVVYTLFDDSVTTQELNPEKWAENSGATMTLSVVTKGDVDGADGATADDLTALRKVLIKAVKSDLYTADINNDGVVDIRDLVNLKKKYI